MRRALPFILVLVAFAILAWLPYTLRPFHVRVGLAMYLAAGMALSWYILGGFAAYYSFGHTAFVGIGGFAAALLVKAWLPQAHWAAQFALGLGAGLVVPAVLAAVIAWPILRLRGHYFTIAMLAVALVCGEVISAFSVFQGASGLALPNVAPPGVRVERFFYWAALAALAGVMLVAWLMGRSRLGYGLYAIREDEDAAAALGKNAFAYRLQTFVMGSMLMGLSGALYANFTGFISPQDLLPIFTFQVFVMLIVGGSGNNYGALLGTVLIWALWTLTETVLSAILPPGLQQQVSAIRVVLVGLILVLMLLYRPQGLLPEKQNVSREARLKP